MPPCSVLSQTACVEQEIDCKLPSILVKPRGQFCMTTSNFRLVGVELYFADLPRAQAFYQQVLGLELAEMQDGHHAKFSTPAGFICLERRGVEDYPSADKAGLFLEVTNLSQAIERIGADRVIERGQRGSRAWAVLHDPEEHNIVLIEGVAGQA